MLSPSMITKSKGNCPRKFTIWRPTSYCSLSPVPLSPITAKRTDFGCSGSFSSGAEACARTGAVRARNKKMERRIRSPRIQSSGYRVGDKIHDQIPACVAENQIVPSHAIVEVLRQFRQIEQQRRGHRLQWYSFRIRMIDAKLEVHRLGAFQA